MIFGLINFHLALYIDVVCCKYYEVEVELEEDLSYLYSSVTC